MKKALFVAVAMSLTSALAAPFVWPAKWSADAPSAAKKGGELRLSAISDFKSMNPFTSSEADSIPLRMGSGATLFLQDPTSDEFIPHMAEAAPTVSNNGKRFVVKLREGMKFSDGQEITADDFVTTMKIHMDKDVGSNSYASFFLSDKPIQVRKLDTYRLQFDFPQVSSSALSRMSYQVWPDHVFGKAHTSGGAAAIKNLWTLNTPANQIVSAGMWVVENYRAGERTVFRKNPNWGEWNKDSAGNALPYLDRMSVRIVADQNANIASFVAGELDTVPVATADQLAQIKRAIDGGNLRASLIANVSPQASSTWITFNWNQGDNADKQKLFRDVRFRRAMSHIANRQAMVDLVYGGLGSPSYYSLYPIFEKAWAPTNTPRYQYNLAEATKLLGQLGYTKKDSEGWLVNAQGRRLEFSLATNAGNNQREGLMRVFADEAKKVGVKVNAQAIDFNVLVNQLTSTGDKRPFDAILLGLSGGANIWPYGSNVVPCTGNLHSYNRSGKCLTAQEQLMSKLYFQGDQELDVAKRKQISAQLVKVESELQPVVYLAAPNFHVAYNSRLGGQYPREMMDAYYGHRVQALTYIK
ncbi:ABC transporter substrate-binding protein [Deinococcus peraridilitoris]|uniref:ABC-type dipeptide transport system, periplasmic component n=1 Tax=Deinococcus peraridilitoris (strain DSM 19664 / LMG 22246 / CIP 109416 / KR-200) TaxID=937777 RepID=L0A700_DEIPD|nr:ABC transporter substrate-binding protein [Deinococcus peraridilitoris]AFZ68830.1 ABC-type dipeptide transport system, periplasmic component [Deinococcus peraridilitoris DSM 19664]